ncbi:hypothetical protein [Planomonospora sp. ID82291]|uniref:hypothetical protein n=1 Tax=Planomonospora sp. ID82291 TaxID=2738136 RepID=UPI0018C3F2B0|nr:hypothetical protein [Planomonospora sp. ID82291]MBG0818906.1 hypothetical protein [Planomonospora sp. ID82291]
MLALALALIAASIAQAITTGLAATRPAPVTICGENLAVALVATKGPNGMEPTHFCGECGLNLWLVEDGASVWCPDCTDVEATEARYPAYM